MKKSGAKWGLQMWQDVVTMWGYRCGKTGVTNPVLRQAAIFITKWQQFFLKLMLMFSPLLLLLPLGGCFGIFVGAAATTGAVVSQETSAGTIVDDTSIYWKIKGLYLEKNAQDLLAGVNVKVIEGRVNLTGKVKLADSAVDAVKLAWQPNGVKEVINEIQIVESPSLKEIWQSKWIKTQIVTKITATKNIRSLNYSVEVVGGIVYLMGIAQDIDELNTVTNIASTVKGVEKVVSHVRVKNDPSRETP